MFDVPLGAQVMVCVVPVTQLCAPLGDVRIKGPVTLKTASLMSWTKGLLDCRTRMRKLEEVMLGNVQENVPPGALKLLAMAAQLEPLSGE